MAQAERRQRSSRRHLRQKRRLVQPLVPQAVQTQAPCLHVLAALVQATIHSQAQVLAWAAHLVLETIHLLRVIAKAVVVVLALLVHVLTQVQCLLVRVDLSVAVSARRALAVLVAQVQAAQVAQAALVVQLELAAQDVPVDLVVSVQPVLGASAAIVPAAVAVSLVAVPQRVDHHVLAQRAVAVKQLAHSVAVAARIRKQRSQSALVAKSSTIWQHRFSVASRFSSAQVQLFDFRAVLRSLTSQRRLVQIQLLW